MSLYTCSVDIIEALDHKLDSKWREFGTHLHVSTVTMDIIVGNNQNVEGRMLQLVEKWLEGEPDSLPRTWKSVVHAVKSMRVKSLAQKLAKTYGV